MQQADKKEIKVSALKIKDLENKLNRKLVIYDTHDESGKQLKKFFLEINETLNKPKICGPIAAVIQELVGNALKAIYKKIFFDQVISVTGIEGLSYEAKLDLFRKEIESHQTENFAYIAKQEGKYATLKLEIKEKEGLFVSVENPGTPTKLEEERIQYSINNAKNISNLNHILKDDKNKAPDDQREGAGLGLPLIIMTLKNLKVPLDNFGISYKNNHTNAHILIPWEVFNLKAKVQKAKDV